jgi:hypothetical protein
VRVRKLLDRDETTVVIPAVFNHLHRRRQDWLDPFLQGRRLRGRFNTGKAGWVPPATDGFVRWLPRQQQQLAALLSRIAEDGQRSSWERASALWNLPRLPVVTVDTLTPFFALKDVPTAEAALGALAWLDRPETALPHLLENLDGDRARVAMYAVPRVASQVSGDTLSATLASLLGREKLKVTVQLVKRMPMTPTTNPEISMGTVRIETTPCATKFARHGNSDPSRMSSSRWGLPVRKISGHSQTSSIRKVGLILANCALAFVRKSPSSNANSKIIRPLASSLRQTLLL